MDPAALLKRQRAVAALGRRTTVPPETSILLQEAAALVAEMLEAEFLGVAEVSPDGDKILARVVSRQPGTITRQFVVKELSTSEDQSLAAYALQLARPVVVADLPAERRFQDQFLDRLEIRSALAMPLRYQGRNLGVLIACSPRPRRFKLEDVPFAEAIGHVTVSTIALNQAEDSLAEERFLAAGLQRILEALVIVLNAQGQILSINVACEQAGDCCLAEVKGRPLWDVFAPPAEVNLYRSAFERLLRGESPLVFESFLLTKGCRQRRIRWSCGALPGVRNTTKTILVTGIDISQQYAGVNTSPLAVSEGMWSKLVSPDNGPQPSGAGDATVPADATGPERRQLARRAYPYFQRIAYILNGQLPPRKSFREVRCHDISLGGICYFSKNRPESGLVVVALGSPPRLDYIVAEVVYAAPIDLDGRHMYKVGCKFTGRARY
jgi:PAS domain-containing protein